MLQLHFQCARKSFDGCEIVPADYMVVCHPSEALTGIAFTINAFIYVEHEQVERITARWRSLWHRSTASQQACKKERRISAKPKSEEFLSKARRFD